jgi:hypothetical protein
LKLNSWQPCGLTPDITCLMPPSFPRHRLKDQQDRMAVRGVEKLLLCAQLFDAGF